MNSVSRVIDCHCHIASEEHVPRSFVEASAQNVAAALSAQGIPITAKKVTAMFLNKLKDPLCDDLLAEMKEAGIGRSVLLAADFSYALRDCVLTVEESFYRHRDVL